MELEGMSKKDVEGLDVEGLRGLIGQFFDQKQQIIEAEEKNDTEENERETKSTAKSKGIADSLITHLINRINITFKKIARNMTSSLTNQFRFRKTLPRKQVEQFVKERAAAGKRTTKEDIDQYSGRVLQKTTKQKEAVENIQEEVNPFYSSTINNGMNAVANFMYEDISTGQIYPPGSIERIVDDNKTPSGYNGYRTGG
jgi:hypothetical protein